MLPESWSAQNSDLDYCDVYFWGVPQKSKWFSISKPPVLTQTTELFLHMNFFLLFVHPCINNCFQPIYIRRQNWKEHILSNLRTVYLLIPAELSKFELEFFNKIIYRNFRHDEKNSMVLWDYCFSLISLIRNLFLL